MSSLYRAEQIFAYFSAPRSLSQEQIPAFARVGRASLAEPQPVDPKAPDAVVAMLVGRDRHDQAFFLLTLRSDTMPTHAGQVAFPGGYRAPQETPEHAVIRECCEELGVASHHLQCHGSWDDLYSRHGVRVRPFVVQLVPRIEELTIRTEWREPKMKEIDQWQWLPVSSLFDEKLWGWEAWKDSRALNQSGNSQSIPRSVLLPVFLGWTHRTWGLTACFLALWVRHISGSFPKQHRAGFSD